MNIERRRRWIEVAERRLRDCLPPLTSVPILLSDQEEHYAASAYLRKRLLSLLRRLRRCPECRGKGTTPGQEWRGRPWMEYQVLVEEECLTCKGTGRL
jgi:hypothetical protein